MWDASPILIRCCVCRLFFKSPDQVESIVRTGRCVNCDRFARQYEAHKLAKTKPWKTRRG